MVASTVSQTPQPGPPAEAVKRGTPGEPGPFVPDPNGVGLAGRSKTVPTRTVPGTTRADPGGPIDKVDPPGLGQCESGGGDPPGFPVKTPGGQPFFPAGHPNGPPDKAGHPGNREGPHPTEAAGISE